jgi:predicted metal-dependent peptidase
MTKKTVRKGNDANIEVEISRCVNQLLLKEPFFSHILSGTVRTISDQIPTAAVGVRDECIMLMINQEYFLNELKTASQRIAVLKHETLHLVLKHLFRNLIKKDPELMNIAADIVVNQYIGEWDLPDSAVTLSTFPDMELESEQTMEYYYERLYELKTKMDSGNKGGRSKYPESQKAFEALYGNKRHSDHSGWLDESASANQSGLKDILENQLLNATARTSQKSFGTLPGEIQRAINRIQESRKLSVDWKRQLRLFASCHGKTYISHTMKRISKRYGTRPGIRIRRLNRVVVVIDTSGSIDNDTLRLFMAEIEGIRRTGSEITVIESDCEVQNVYAFNRRREISMQGGGGTDFDPAFEYINSRKSGSFDACIYLTDGYAPEPKIKPRTSLLWVLTPDGNSDIKLRWGRRLLLRKSE